MEELNSYHWYIHRR